LATEDPGFAVVVGFVLTVVAFGLVKQSAAASMTLMPAAAVLKVSVPTIV
jgi:hypothetical protein